MASIVDAFNNAFSDKFLYLKMALYAIPVYFCIQFFMKGQMSYFYILGSIFTIIYAGLLAVGLNNVNTNRIEILTLNPIKLFKTIFKMLVVMIPQILVFGFFGNVTVQRVTIPIDLPHAQLIFSIVVWAVFCAILLTSYLSFSRKLSIKSGFNYLEIIPASLDIFVGLLFAVPQFLILNLILVGAVGYLFWFFNIALTHWTFLGYCSLVFIFNISILADYLAQMAYEHFKFSKDDAVYTQLNSIITDTDTERRI